MKRTDQHRHLNIFPRHCITIYLTQSNSHYIYAIYTYMLKLYIDFPLSPYNMLGLTPPLPKKKLRSSQVRHPGEVHHGLRRQRGLRPWRGASGAGSPCLGNGNAGVLK
jgi:hypothetical protein